MSRLSAVAVVLVFCSVKTFLPCYVRSQYMHSGPIQVGVPVKLMPEDGMFEHAYMPSTADKQYVQVSPDQKHIIVPAHVIESLQKSEDQRQYLSQEGFNRAPVDQRVPIQIVVPHQQVQSQQPEPYPAKLAENNQEENSHERASEFKTFNHEHQKEFAHDRPLQLPKERVSVSSFPSMRAAKENFGEHIKLDASKLKKDLDNVQWREEIVYPPAGPSRINWNPKGYVENERIAKARKNHYVYAEFREEPEEQYEEDLQRRGKSSQIQYEQKEEYSPHQKTPHESTEVRSAKTLFSHEQKPGGVLEQQPYRIKEEEQLRSQYGYTGKAQVSQHDIRYPGKEAQHQYDAVDYEKAFNQDRTTGEIPQQKVRHHQSRTELLEGGEGGGGGGEGGIEYSNQQYERKKIRYVNDRGEPVNVHEEDYAIEQPSSIQQADHQPHVESSSKVHRRPSRKHHYYDDEQRRSPQEEDDEDDGYRHIQTENTNPRRSKIQRVVPHKTRKIVTRPEYRPTYDSGESTSDRIRLANIHDDVTEQRYLKNSKPSFQEFGHLEQRTPHRVIKAPRKHIIQDDEEEYEPVAMKKTRRKKKPVVYEDEEEEVEPHEQPRRFNVRFENNPGQDFSFRKNNRKGNSAEKGYTRIHEEEIEEDDDPKSFHGMSIGPSTEGGVNLNFKMG